MAMLSSIARRDKSFTGKLPTDVWHVVFDQLLYEEDSSASQCLGLTCKAFYALHKKKFPDIIDLDTICWYYTTYFPQKRLTYCHLEDLLKNWIDSVMKHKRQPELYDFGSALVIRGGRSI